ncbi:MAG: YbaB/EbfC family nucleoid-associated protein [Candidatus Gastranaerophilales bacterium]|nr:YbaB/EbfC family nucleoid-associated protein [Candidatus Gastranaerophilales bacterium]
MFNMQNMMQQVQKMQQQANKLQAELDAMTFTGAVGGGIVEVDVTGQARFKTIRIKPEAINPENPQSVSKETIEMLEDMIASAIVEANKQAAIVAQERMSAVTAGLNIPGFGGGGVSPKPKAPGEKPDGFGDLGGFGNLMG